MSSQHLVTMGEQTPSRGPGSALYDASSIAVLKGMEAVRRHPAMYVGSTGPEGLHHLVAEVVANAVDEASAGHCNQIRVIIQSDGSCAVEDNGRGIPVGTHPTLGRPACEVVLTTLHSGSKFRPGSYRCAGGLHGIGVSCVNALSQWLLLDVWRDGHHFAQRFRCGEVETPLKNRGPSDQRGTRIHFRPDPEVFGEENRFSYERLAEQLMEVAFLNTGLTIEFVDQRQGQRHVFSGDGIVGLVRHLNRARTTLHPDPISICATTGELNVEAALQWTTAYADDIRSYVNSIRTLDGGSHEAGLLRALRMIFNSFAAQRELIDVEAGERISNLDIIDGLTGGLSVRMPEPQFEGQTKTRLHSARVFGLVEKAVAEQLEAFFGAHDELALLIVGRTIEATRARVAARRSSEQARYQNTDALVNEAVYQKQFGIRSKNWHDSALWITSDDILQAHAELCQMPEDAKMLDVCCGTGVVGAVFDERVGQKIGLDLTPEMANIARERLDEVHLGTVYDLPFSDESFDLVVTREVLHILPRPELPVAEIFRVLRPGGQFIVGQTLPYGAEDAPWMWRVFKKKQPLIFNMFQEAGFRQLLSRAGFVQIDMIERLVWESIDLWIDTHETSNLHRHEIRRLFYDVPEIVRAIHPFQVLPSGEIRDCWRWGIFSGRKPTAQ